jgi:hypothetical protein
MAPKKLISPPCCNTGSLGAGYTGVDDGQAFMRLCDRLEVRQHSFYEIRSRVSDITPDLM